MADDKPRLTRESVAKLIENLNCLPTVDVMLLEGTPAVDVARFIQKDQGELKDLDEAILVNGVIARLRQRQEISQWWNAGLKPDAPVGGYRRPAQTPKLFIKGLYAKAEAGIQQMLELEALYLAQRDRIDRIMELESEAGAFSDKTGQEIMIAANIVEKHFEIAKDLGVVEGGDAYRLSVDIKGYSERTAQVLSNPESRRRVISIVERIAQHARRADVVDAPLDDGFKLPPPKASGSGK